MTAKSLMDDPNNVELILHVGDLSYADGNHTKWDIWGRMFEFSSSKIPWMTLPGNHENEFYSNLISPFIAYQTRFRMPENKISSERNLYWSIDYSYVHLVALSTESNYLPMSSQYNWFIRDMKRVNRTKTPFVVVMFHRPFYNSNKSLFSFGFQ
jgi:hypothetical protein